MCKGNASKEYYQLTLFRFSSLTLKHSHRCFLNGLVEVVDFILEGEKKKAPILIDHVSFEKRDKGKKKKQHLHLLLFYFCQSINSKSY